MKKIIEKVWNGVAICVGVVFGIACFGWLAGAVAILLLNFLLPKFPADSVMPPANNIADWRSLVVIAIGCLAILCFFAIKSVVSRPLGKLVEKGFAKWDSIIARRPSLEWIGQFVLSKPTPEEIKAASAWADHSNEFDKEICTKQYRLGSYEADDHALRKHKKSLASYPRLKKTAKIRGCFLGVPICLFFVLILFAGQSERDVDDQETADNQEVVDRTASTRWFENPELRKWSWNLTWISLAFGFPLWAISSLSEKRFLRLLGADIRPDEADDEIYVADPTDFESWRQAFIEQHGHDMSSDQEKKLRLKVDKVIDAYDQERAAVRKLSEKIDEEIRSTPR